MKHEHRFYPVGDVTRTVFDTYVTWYCDCGDFKRVAIKEDLTEPKLKKSLREQSDRAFKETIAEFKISA